ncbi:MAG TPA: HlyD family efflux transporter periplasmic adaptor subunit [Eoetvoesiella sp.]|uniref:HlyD family secretion protein n=1 Tax=Eoetvoesiella sp. TaxID=1966355 RepID=UPI002BA70DE3|nr:HlyD family efflux transporter periplasmic adaptor subunit [Eoetvoesiella sp.]HWK63082.1 HlyD family efflux transporter periplasmic adaptor subunit [Eoetvoesiella sp.]
MSSAQPKSSQRKRLLTTAALAFIVLGIAYAIWWFIFAAHYESTDDAYVHGNIVQVTPQIAGTIIGIDADDTQIVAKGAPLVKLDSVDTDVALAQAEAELAQTVRKTRTLFVQNDALEADIAMRQANLDKARADLSRAESDLKRRKTLAQSGGVSGEEILHAQAALKAAQAGVAQAQATLASAKANLLTNQSLTANTTVAKHPDVLRAAAQVRQAWLAKARTQLLAPVSGMIAERSAQVGQHVAPGTPLMTIVPMHQLWVEANFKEVQLRKMKPGQSVTMTADLYGGSVEYHGTVEGITAGTGSAFALLPAQNATGNWIKVVQRVPVRIALDPKDVDAHPLRIGLSMQVEVDLNSGGDKAEKAEPPTTLETDVYAESAKGADALINKIIQDNLGS